MNEMSCPFKRMMHAQVGFEMVQGTVVVHLFVNKVQGLGYV
jgi:hypothetical protein